MMAIRKEVKSYTKIQSLEIIKYMESSEAEYSWIIYICTNVAHEGSSNESHFL